MRLNNFKGKRIAITSFDLQQKEHRGIAQYTKNLIKVLHENGAEIFLITNIAGKRIKRNKNKAFFEEVSIADICYKFQKGSTSQGDAFRKNKILFIFKIFLNLLRIIVNRFKLNYKIINLNDLQKNIHINESKFDFLNQVSGFIVVKGIFDISLLRSRRYIFKIPKLNIKKNDIDLIICSSPLCIRSDYKGYAPIVQIIYDAIPIQDPHYRAPLSFLNTLSDAHTNKCVYISSSAQKIVHNILQLSNMSNELDILRPLPSISLEILNNSLLINSLLGIKKPFILINCSIVSWKKIEKGIQFFNESNLGPRGFLLCIAGQTHNTRYSKHIKELCDKNPNILLLGYVSESEKTWLYLNTSLLISTSATEGFGIPVMDSASLTIPVIANKIPSFIEIKEIFSPNQITLIDLKEKQEWINCLNKTEVFNIEDNEAKKSRIKNYSEFCKISKQETTKKILNLIGDKI